MARVKSMSAPEATQEDINTPIVELGQGGRIKSSDEHMKQLINAQAEQIARLEAMVRKVSDIDRVNKFDKSENRIEKKLCRLSYFKDELIFYVPNTFTPDNDDYNQTFLPVFTSGYDPYDFSLLIFNRWGEIIFESHDAKKGWDGSYGNNGEVEFVQDGTYSWKLEFKTSLLDDHKVYLGHVNIIR
jgi:gliding motility-associated-like protein